MKIGFDTSCHRHLPLLGFLDEYCERWFIHDNISMVRGTRGSIRGSRGSIRGYYH